MKINSFQPTIHNTVFVGEKYKMSENRTNKNADKNLTKEAVFGLSLVTLGTLAGLYYFSRHGANLKKNGRTFEDYYLSNTNYIPTFTEFQPKRFYGDAVEETFSVSQEPIWERVDSYEITEKFKNIGEKTTAEADKPKTTKHVPGIIKKISGDIKQYMARHGINKNNKKINPERLDEILTNAVGEPNVKEYPYLENGKRGSGRVKHYTSPNGRIYVLETHKSPKGIVTRLYMQESDKSLRAYLHPDGTFRLNSYTSELSHFDTSSKGKDWMEASPFMKNRA